MIERLEKVAQRPVSRETMDNLQAYVRLLKEENERQNLISAATLADIWNRHILDSAQLVRFEPGPGVSWIDIGGIVIACLVDGPVTMVEPRRLRAEFLHKVSESLHLRANVLCSKAERVGGRYDVITARAVANLSNLLELSAHLSTGNTVWALPKGRNAQGELAEAKLAWQGEFHVERSVTGADSWIVVGTGVRAKR